MAERMAKYFGVDIMHIIEDSPQRLIEVDGLGPKHTAMITTARAEQKAIKEVAHDSPERIKAALAYTLSEAANDRIATCSCPT
jgi:hypothetical protein